MGTGAKDIQIVDLATNPISRQIYISVARGRGPDATPVLLRVKPDGMLEEVNMKNVPNSHAAIPNPGNDKQGARENPRTLSITDIAYINVNDRSQ